MTATFLLLSCGTKVPKSGKVVRSQQMDVEQTAADTVITQEKTERKADFDNTRGFDPASEDDMPDNVMSRYMENNDDEGWD